MNDVKGKERTGDVVDTRARLVLVSWKKHARERKHKQKKHKRRTVGNKTEEKRPPKNKETNRLTLQLRQQGENLVCFLLAPSLAKRSLTEHKGSL